jgi:hypothetical protein
MSMSDEKDVTNWWLELRRIVIKINIYLTSKY